MIYERPSTEEGVNTWQDYLSKLSYIPSYIPKEIKSPKWESK